MSRKKEELNYEISEIATFYLQGIAQKVSIEGKSKDLPVVINLHGGPGSPFPFYVGSRGLHKEYTDHFILVCWDQLGSGVNNRTIDDTYSIDSYVEMTNDLVKEIRVLFPGNKIFLYAISWGSEISANYVGKYPYMVDGVIVFGQIVKNAFLNEEVISCLEKSDIPKKKLDAIKKINPKSCSKKETGLVSNAIMKYTEGYYNKNTVTDPNGLEFKDVFKSPDYRLKDKLAVIGINGCKKNNSLWDAVLQSDVSEILKKVEIPYRIIQGETDIVASTKTVSELVEEAKNENLSVRVLANFGHIGGLGLDEIIAEEINNVAINCF